MKITFKDVGQGDSIILEWQRDGINKVGIIDCNLKGPLNPVLDHIKDKYNEIEFIVLSHPHQDHYSGLLELLEYVEEHKITIKRFAHTLLWAGPTKFWKYFEVNSTDNRQLNKIVKKWKSLKTAGYIARMDNLEDGKFLTLENNIKLECLAPSHDDGEEYMRIVKLDADKYAKEASQAANLLSTVFRLHIDGRQIGLLTSDAEKFAIEGIIKREGESFKGEKYKMCQLPHHGSIKNYHENFWDILETEENKQAFISAGKNRRYNHPSREVIEVFDSRGYILHCTSGIEDYIDQLIQKSLVLDTVSEIAEEYYIKGDKEYTF